jgi:serine/threonine protein phosphatase 1
MVTLSRAPANLPEGRRIYAIGDIHGCDEQLGNLHAIIAEDLARRPVDAPLLLPRDYVDRGADTASVLRRLLARSPIEVSAGGQSPRQPRRHDAARAVRRSAGGDRLAVHRRPTCVGDYGIDPDSPRESWPERVPAEHLDFPRNLTLAYRDGGYFFVHGGASRRAFAKHQARGSCCACASRFSIPRCRSAPWWCTAIRR